MFRNVAFAAVYVAVLVLSLPPQSRQNSAPQRKPRPCLREQLPR